VRRGHAGSDRGGRPGRCRGSGTCPPPPLRHPATRLPHSGRRPRLYPCRRRHGRVHPRRPPLHGARRCAARRPRARTRPQRHRRVARAVPPRSHTVAWATPSLTTAWASARGTYLGSRSFQLRTGTTLGGSSAIHGRQWTEPLVANTAGWGAVSPDAPAARRATAAAVRALGVAPTPAGLRHKDLGAWLALSQQAGLPKAINTTGRHVAAGAWRHRLAVSRSGRPIDACTAVVALALRGAYGGRPTVRSGVTVTAMRLAAARGAEAAPTTRTGEAMACQTGRAGWPPRPLPARRRRRPCRRGRRSGRPPPHAARLPRLHLRARPVRHLPPAVAVWRRPPCRPARRRGDARPPPTRRGGRGAAPAADAHRHLQRRAFGPRQQRVAAVVVGRARRADVQAGRCPRRGHRLRRWPRHGRPRRLLDRLL